VKIFDPVGETLRREARCGSPALFLSSGPAYSDSDRWRQAVDELSNRESPEPPDSPVIGSASDLTTNFCGIPTRNADSGIAIP